MFLWTLWTVLLVIDKHNRMILPTFVEHVISDEK